MALEGYGSECSSQPNKPSASEDFFGTEQLLLVETLTMRVLFSGVIGAVVSASAWLAAEHFQQEKFGWMVCLIGLVTGIAMHKASQPGSGKASGKGFARGALAVVLTFAAIVGGQKAYAMYMQASSEAASVVTSESFPDAGKGGLDEKAKPAGASAVVLSELEADAIGLGQGDYTKSAIKNNFSDWDMIWMGLAALAAYVTGKGGDGATPVLATEEHRGEDADESQGTQEKEDA